MIGNGCHVLLTPVVMSWARCLQHLELVLTQALFLPCLMSAQEEGQPAELPGYPHVAHMPSGRHLVRHHLLSIMPSVLKGTRSGLWFWQHAMPHCPGWLEDYVEWMIDSGKRTSLNIAPYLALFGKQWHPKSNTSTGPCKICAY